MRTSKIIKEYKEIASKVKDLEEFRLNYPEAYAFADKHFLLYEWFEINHRYGTIALIFWKKEEVIYISEHCESMNEFVLYHRDAYISAKKNGWINDINLEYNEPKLENYINITKSDIRNIISECPTKEYFIETYPELNELINTKDKTIKSKSKRWKHLFKKINTKPKSFWTDRDLCWETASKYSSKSELFKYNLYCFKAAKINNWLNSFEWEPSYQNRDKYTKEMCIDAARKCSTYSEFRNEYLCFYDAARRHEWLDEICKVTGLERCIQTDVDYNKPYMIYVYEDNINKYAYVGLTKDFDNRHKHHCSNMDPVRKHFDKFNLPVPEPKILYRDLTREEALELETNTFYLYRDEYKYILINGELNLGMLGSSREKYSKFDVIEASKQFTTLPEFHKKCRWAYDKACKLGILHELTWLKDVCYSKNITREDCYNKALEYKTRSEFAKKAITYYKKALDEGWMDDYTWFKPKPNYTREKCYEIASKCKNISEFRKKYSGAFEAACRNGWLDDYTWFPNKYTPLADTEKMWTREECYNEALKYPNSKEFARKAGGAYNVSLRNGWLKDYTWFKRPAPVNRIWFEDNTREESKKYTSEKDFRKYSNQAWLNAKRNGWLSSYTWLYVKTSETTNEDK